MEEWGSVGETEVTNGIRHACKGSPQLFVMIVDVIIDSVVDSRRDVLFLVVLWTVCCAELRKRRWNIL